MKPPIPEGMTIENILHLNPGIVRGFGKLRLFELFLWARGLIISLFSERAQLQAENDSLKKRLEQYEGEKVDGRINSVNATVNQPTSKVPEWAPKGSPKGGKDGKKNKKPKKKKPRRAQKGSGNKPKPVPDIFHTNKLDCCPNCETDLKDSPVIETRTRVIEDIPPPPRKTVVIQETQERKWCDGCKTLVCSVSESALPKSDLGLNALIMIAYQWVVMASPFATISNFLKVFFNLILSASGISKMMIRLANILSPVVDEIRRNIRSCEILNVDETGWRIRGKLHWLWVFGDARSAFYLVSPSRGQSVVEAVLGEIFNGVLVTDGWCAYASIICAKQTCMAHIFRKIRAFRDAFPEEWRILAFYKALKRIIKAGIALQSQKNQLTEEVFNRRAAKLAVELDDLLMWEEPSAVLADIMAKVERQKYKILTFVHHPFVPTHNNFAEFLVKLGIKKRKTSGGSVSLEGAQAFAILLSIATTLKLRKLCFTTFLRDSLVQYIRTGRPLLLSEFEAKIGQMETRRSKDPFDLAA
jgi:transposase